MKCIPTLLPSVLLVACFSGCSREEKRVERSSVEVSLPTPAAEERTATWTYKSEQYGFALDLPSAGWKDFPRKPFVVNFWRRSSTSSPMLVGVTSVKKQTREEFEASFPKLRASFAGDSDYLEKPISQVGKTDRGHLYHYTAACEKGNAGNAFTYVAMASVWITDKGITVTTIFEGQGEMRSNLFKSIEYAEFEKSARVICLSLR